MGQRVGFVGLSVMGKPMAFRLREAGLELVALERANAATRTFLHRGAVEASTPAEVATTTDQVIHHAAGPPDVEEVLLRSGGALERLPTEGLLIDMSSIAPNVARRNRLSGQRRAEALDAAVSGGETGAKEGSLSIMVGGTPDGFACAQPVLSYLGLRIFHVGSAGAGQVAEATNKIIPAGTLTARRRNSDPRAARRRRSGPGTSGPRRCFADSRVLQVHAQRLLDRAISPGFRIRVQAKAAREAPDQARDIGLSMPVTQVVASVLNDLVDHAALNTALDSAPPPPPPDS